jgi:hypothetical protein
MNVIYATFIREWTDRENSVYPGQKGSARLGACEATKPSDRNVDKVPSSGGPIGHVAATKKAAAKPD